MRVVYVKYYCPLTSLVWYVLMYISQPPQPDPAGFLAYMSPPSSSQVEQDTAAHALLVLNK